MSSRGHAEDGWPGDPVRFGQWLRKLRELAGFTRGDLAARAQINWYTLRNIEKGLHATAPDKRERLIAVLREAWNEKAGLISAALRDEARLFIGTSLDELLAADGTLAEVNAVALERVRGWMESEAARAPASAENVVALEPIPAMEPEPAPAPASAESKLVP